MVPVLIQNSMADGRSKTKAQATAISAKIWRPRSARLLSDRNTAKIIAQIAPIAQSFSPTGAITSLKNLGRLRATVAFDVRSFQTALMAIPISVVATAGAASDAKTNRTGSGMVGNRQSRMRAALPVQKAAANNPMSSNVSIFIMLKHLRPRHQTAVKAHNKRIWSPSGG